MWGLHCFGIDSCLRLIGGRCGLIWLGFGQLGPDFSPVFRAQVAAGDGAGGGAFDGQAMLNGHTAHFPITERRRRDAQPFGQSSTPTKQVGSLIDRVLRGTHGMNINTSRVVTQHHVLTQPVFNLQ